MKLFYLRILPCSFFIFFIIFSVDVKCKDEIMINGVNYKIENKDSAKHLLKIKRIDISDDFCLTNGVDTSLDSTPFKFELDTLYITLFYGCPPNGGPTCGTNTNNGIYYTIGSEDNSAHLSIISECNSSVVIYTLPNIVNEQMDDLQQFPPDREALKVVTDGGFNVIYDENKYLNCQTTCLDKGKNCIYNGEDLNCVGGKNINRVLIVGVVLGSVAGVLLTLFFLYMRRRKQKTSRPSKFTSRNISSERSLSRDLEIGESSYFQTPIFSYSELEEATNNFDEEKEVGDGGFGTVYYGKLRDGRVVAVKRLYENNCKRVEQFMNEITILSRLRHKHLVSLYGCTSRHSRELLLVYEYIPNGTIADHLHGENVKPGKLTWPLRMKIAIETADALSYLHASDTIHRDVKSNNILLENNFDVKVADFGLSRLFPNDVTHVSTAPQGTPGYVDPEYFQCYQLTDKSDVYSFGVVLCELISSKPAVDISRHRYDINLSNMAIKKIQNHSVHEFVDPHLGFETNFSIRKSITQVAELAFRCLQQDKDMRPSMVEVLEVLRGIEQNDYSQADEIDILSDEYLLKGNPPLSPNSVTDIWSSTKTTPNTSA